MRKKSETKKELRRTIVRKHHTPNMSYSQIAKDQIPDQLISKREVLSDPDEQKKRRDQLLKAVQHNRLFYTKARITFDTADETKEVSANIWEVTDNHVLLKGGINLPVCCIREVVLESEVTH